MPIFDREIIEINDLYVAIDEVDSGDGSALYSGLYERKSLLKETNISEYKKI